MEEVGVLTGIIGAHERKKERERERKRLDLIFSTSPFKHLSE